MSLNKEQMNEIKAWLVNWLRIPPSCVSSLYRAASFVRCINCPELTTHPPIVAQKSGTRTQRLLNSALA